MKADISLNVINTFTCPISKEQLKQETQHKTYTNL